MNLSNFKLPKLNTSHLLPVFEATKELLFSILLSTLPIWLVPLIVSIVVASEYTFPDLITQSVKSGELFVYAASTLGPIAYIILSTKESPSEDSTKRRFIAIPGGWVFGLIAILLAFGCGVGYGLLRLNEINIISFEVKQEAMLSWSTILYAFSLLCLFLVLLLRNTSVYGSASQLMLDDTEAAVDRWNRRGNRHD